MSRLVEISFTVTGANAEEITENAKAVADSYQEGLGEGAPEFEIRVRPFVVSSDYEGVPVLWEAEVTIRGGA